METKVSAWTPCHNGPWYPGLSHGGYVAYRIWKQTDGRRWWQRHEWKRADGSLEMDDWIDSFSGWGSSYLAEVA